MLEFLLGHSMEAFRNGEFAFARGWPLWLFWLCAAVGIAAIAFTLSRRQLGLWRAGALGLLQSAFLLLLLVLLWRPVVNVEQIRDRENVVAVLMDDSGSMNLATGANTPTRRTQALTALNAGTLKEIGSRSTLRLFAFSDRAQSVESLDQLPGGAAATRIGDALDTVTQMAASVPVAAIVLVSDGADTGSTLSEAALARLAATGIPVHTVGVGPEQPVNDLELEQLQVADSAMAGATLRATVSIRHQGQKATKVRVYDGDIIIAAQDVQLGAAPGLATTTVEFPAGDAGVRDLRVVVDPLPAETVLANNERRALVEVDGRRRGLLYVEGEPRWEYKFIRRSVDDLRALRVVSAVRATPNRYYRQGVTSGKDLENGFPATAEELFGYDAVILGSLEAAALSQDQHQWLKDFVDRRGGSLLLLAGRDGLGDGGWGRVPVAQALPAVLPTGADHSYGALASHAQLTEYGRESPIGRFDNDPARNEKQWQELPALTDFQDLGKLRPGAVVLLETVVKSNTGQRVAPLMVTQRYGRGATYLLGTASTWHWQMQLPAEDKLRGIKGDQRHETFWRQLLNALASPAPTPVSLHAERAIFEDDQPVVLEAEVLDDSYRAVPDAKLEVRATSESGAEVPATIVPSGSNDGRYDVAVDARATGLYRVELTAMAGKKELGRATTHLRRADGVLEQFSAWQHRPMLERIAHDSGGRYWTLDDLDGLPEAIRYSRAGMVERQTLDLWNIPLAFLLLAMLKSGEWLLRRYWSRL
ncbi:MAG: hypothetical protein ABIQ86_10015 [Steroidobacteraceae bacterium]